MYGITVLLWKTDPNSEPRPTPQSPSYDSIQERRVDHVGEWLVSTEESRRWNGWSGGSDADKTVLLLPRRPGGQQDIFSGKGNYFLGTEIVSVLECSDVAGSGQAVRLGQWIKNSRCIFLP